MSKVDKVYTMDYPAHYASALVNGDYSGDLDDDELQDIKNIIEFNDGSALACQGDEFMGRHRGLMCQMIEYVFIE